MTVDKTSSDALLKQEAREIVAKWYEEQGAAGFAASIRAGKEDGYLAIQFVLSGLKRGMELADAKGCS